MSSEEKKYVSVALDGPSGAGKSSIARSVAQELGFLYVDTGAIYRTVAYCVRQKGVDPKDAQAVAALLPEMVITMGYDGAGLQRMYLNGEDVTKEIRLPEISMCASQVSEIPAVRDFLLDMQRDMAKKHNVIMDGRDIATVVLPDADVKVYLTASSLVRAKRRYKELVEKGVACDLSEIEKDIIDRDYRDMHREHSPLVQAEDAVYLDSSDMTLKEVVDSILNMIDKKRGV